jgi:hypothetical protein
VQEGLAADRADLAAAEEAGEGVRPEQLSAASQYLRRLSLVS